jgi:pimeloyl-ACP methyl ester carboxylesterase
MSVRRIAGSGSARELVWIHGLGESSTSFDPVVAKLPQLSHTLVDLPGYGRSAWPDEPFGLEALADHLAAWLKARPLATVLGHSMGGVLAVMLAERGAANAIVDIDGNVTRADCTFSAQATACGEAEFVDHGFATMRDQIYRDGVEDAPLRTYQAALCFAQPRTFYKQASDLVALSEAETMAPRLAALTIPALFVAGVPRGISQASRAALDHHRVRWIGIEPAGHWVYLDQIEKFASAIAHFV